jgi:hypothetical protein
MKQQKKKTKEGKGKKIDYVQIQHWSIISFTILGSLLLPT